MENLHNYLPKDLVNIVEEYSKDRTNYEQVLNDFNRRVFAAMKYRYMCTRVKEIVFEIEFASDAYYYYLNFIMLSKFPYKLVIRFIKNQQPRKFIFK